jgi:hypothetical protein
MTDSSSEEPVDPFLPAGLAHAMKAMYDMYAAGVQAGFTEVQSMQLVTATLTTMMSTKPPSA